MLRSHDAPEFIGETGRQDLHSDDTAWAVWDKLRFSPETQGRDPSWSVLAAADELPPITNGNTTPRPLKMDMWGRTFVPQMFSPRMELKKVYRMDQSGDGYDHGFRCLI